MCGKIPYFLDNNTSTTIFQPINMYKEFRTLEQNKQNAFAMLLYFKWNVPWGSHQNCLSHQYSRTVILLLLFSSTYWWIRRWSCSLGSTWMFPLTNWYSYWCGFRQKQKKNQGNLNSYYLTDSYSLKFMLYTMISIMNFSGTCKSKETYNINLTSKFSFHHDKQ